MNRTLAILLLFLSVLFTACQSDEPAIDEGSKTDGKAAQAYMNIRIGMANIPGSRATSPGTEDGTDAEQSVSSLLLKFYDANGKFYGYGDPVTDLSVTRPTNGKAEATGHNEEGYIGATVVLTINDGDAKPSYVVAYLNCGTKKTPEPDMTDLSETVSTVHGENSTNFFMTSSNFHEKGYQTSVSEDKFFDSAAAAIEAENNQENWVNIYVERLAAKVKVVNNAKSDDNTNVPVESNGYKLTFTYTGYNLGGINTNSYLIKNIDGFEPATPWNGWNDANNHRSYWAKDVNYTYEIPNPNLGYKSYNNGSSNNGALYCAENTFGEVDSKVKNPYLVQPFVYVFGYYTVTDKDDKSVTAAALYEYAGKIYTSEDIIKVIQNSIGSFLFTKLTTGEGESTKDVYTPIVLTKDDVDIVSCKNQDIQTDKNDASRIMLKLCGNYSIQDNAYVKQIGTDGTVSYVSASIDNINGWLATQKITVNGFTKDTDTNHYPVYFPVLVEHLNWNDGSAGEVGAYGIVRNHVYKIEINSIKNLGVGIFDPTVDIIPHEKVKKMYLAAKINILSWKIVNQTVNL